MDCSKIAHVLPSFRPSWTVRRGVEELYEAYQRSGLTLDDLQGARYIRLARIRERMNDGSVDEALRVRQSALVS